MNNVPSGNLTAVESQWTSLCLTGEPSINGPFSFIFHSYVKLTEGPIHIHVFVGSILINNGNFRILNGGTVPYKAIFFGDIHLHRPYTGLIYGRYLQFRILEWPVMSNPISSDHAPAGGPRQSWWVSQSTAGAAEPSETIFIVQPELISPDCNTISYELAMNMY